jgi:hypothetical protein
MRYQGRYSYVSFSGVADITGGTHRYIHTSGSLGFYGVLNRESDVVRFQTRGTLAPTARAGRPMGRPWTFAHLGRQVGRIHREVPGSKGIWHMRPRSAHGLFEPFSRFLSIFPEPLHTREVAGSKPAAPIGLPQAVSAETIS